MAAHLAPASRPSADKIKAFHALLLSLAVIAGAVTITTDAYAQTNTERLITVVDNTTEANSLLSSILDAVTSGFANVLEMLGVIDTDLEAIHGDLSAVDTNLQEIHGDLEEIHGDLETLDGHLSGLSQAASGLNAVTQSLTTVSQGVTANSASINALNAKLDMISDAVGVVNDTATSIQVAVETDPETAATGPTNMLHSDETEQAVTVADFAGEVTKHPTDGVYEASNTFSCTGDVFLDSMAVTGVDEALYTVTTIATDDVAPKTTVSLNGVNLYETYDNTAAGTAASATSVLQITKDRDFDNQFLAAGSTLVIKGSTDQSADGDATAFVVADIATRGAQNILEYEVNATAAPAEGANVYFTLADYVALKTNKATINATNPDVTDAGTGTNQATKTQLGTTELYTVTVKWFSASSDTTCSISSAIGTTPGLDNEGTVLVGVSVNATATGATKPILPETVDCGGETTEITGVSIEAGAVSGLGQYNTIELRAGDSSSTVRFDSSGTVDEDKSKLPFTFSGADLTVTGTALNDLLIQLSYATVKGNACEATR